MRKLVYDKEKIVATLSCRTYKTYKNTLKHTKTYKNTQKHSKTYKNTQKCYYSGLVNAYHHNEETCYDKDKIVAKLSCRTYTKHTKTHRNIQKHTKTHKNIQKHIKTLKNVIILVW